MGLRRASANHACSPSRRPAAERKGGIALARRLCTLLVVSLLSVAAAMSAPTPPKPPQETFTALREGSQLFKQGKWAEAINALGRAVVEDPNSDKAWFLLGRAHMQLYQWGEAEKALQRASAINGRQATVWVSLGECAMFQGQYDRAREFVRRVLHFDSRSAYAYYALGVIDYKQGNIGPAMNKFEHARALYDEYAPTWYNLAVCTYNQGNAKLALLHIRKAILIDGKKPLYLFLQGWYGFMSRDTALGHLGFRRLFEEDNHRSAYSDTARAFLAMLAKNHAEAEKLLEEALAKDPEMAKALVLKGMLLVHKNKRAEAIAVVQEALDIDPLDADARDVLKNLGVTPPPPRPARLPGQKSSQPAPTPSPVPSGVPTSSPSAPPPPPGVPR